MGEFRSGRTDMHRSGGDGGLNRGSRTRPGWTALLPPTRDQQEEISAVFAVLKPDDEKTVDYYAVKAALKGMGFVVRKRELLQVMEQCCPHTVDGDRFSQSDFAAVVVRYMARRSPEEQLVHDFALLDSDAKGYIDMGDLRRVVKSLPTGASVSDADITFMMQMMQRRCTPGHGARISRPFDAPSLSLEDFAAAVGSR